VPATQVLQDGIVTLTPEGVAAVAGNAELWNEDLRPCTREEHNWGSNRFASLWIGMCLCIPTYSLASGMISLGMNWWQSVLTVFTGSLIVLIPLLLVAHAGTRYGIPYPVFSRSVAPRCSTTASKCSSESPLATSGACAARICRPLRAR